jgi:hypothetical protein
LQRYSSINKLPYCCPTWKFVARKEDACIGTCINVPNVGNKVSMTTVIRLITLKGQIPVDNSYAPKACQQMHHKIGD